MSEDATYENITVISFFQQKYEDDAVGRTHRSLERMRQLADNGHVDEDLGPIEAQIDFLNLSPEDRTKKIEEAEAEFEVLLDKYRENKDLENLRVKVSREQMRYKTYPAYDAAIIRNGRMIGSRHILPRRVIVTGGSGGTDGAVTATIEVNFCYDLSNPSNSKKSVHTVTFAPGEMTVDLVAPRLDPHRTSSVTAKITKAVWGETGSGTGGALLTSAAEASDDGPYDEDAIVRSGEYYTGFRETVPAA
ncbi:hypothetical protein [Streptomyces sp. NPDC002082]|uniref:hypothetical protein n=1 Tax=Streptomyces sp. NPDC002082 TaxID=3154772 RepID=UPI00332C3B5A